MKIIVYGSKKDRRELVNNLKFSLEELGLLDLIKLETTDKQDLKNEMGIKTSLSLIIEEESIGFKDVIFEGQTPSKEEIKSMLISIIGAGNGDVCSYGSCSGCSDSSGCGL